MSDQEHFERIGRLHAEASQIRLDLKRLRTKVYEQAQSLEKVVNQVYNLIQLGAAFRTEKATYPAAIDLAEKAVGPLELRDTLAKMHQLEERLAEVEEALAD